MGVLTRLLTWLRLRLHRQTPSPLARLADLADLSASPPSSLCRPRRSAALVALITAGLAALVATRRDPTGRL